MNSQQLGGGYRRTCSASVNPKTGWFLRRKGSGKRCVTRMGFDNKPAMSGDAETARRVPGTPTAPSGRACHCRAKPGGFSPAASLPGSSAHRHDASLRPTRYLPPRPAAAVPSRIRNLGQLRAFARPQHWGVMAIFSWASPEPRSSVQDGTPHRPELQNPGFECGMRMCPPNRLFGEVSTSCRHLEWRKFPMIHKLCDEHLS